MRPVAPRERIVFLDVLRGLALAGIVVANIRGFGSPMEAYNRPRLLWNSPADQAANFLLETLVTGKFLTIFSILFGLGFAIQVDRARERGARFVRLYLRRMAILALFGAAHVLLLWWGDILLSYAVAGALLLLFRNRNQESLIRWSLALYWLPVALFLGLTMLSALEPMAAAPEAPGRLAGAMRHATAVYRSADGMAIFHQRIEDWRAFNASFPVVLPRILGLFLFGFWLWREGIVQRPRTHAKRIRRYLPRLLAAGLGGNLVFAAVNHVYQPDLTQPGASAAVMWVAASTGVPALSLAIGAVVLLAGLQPRWQRLLKPFSFVGRTALTNYLLQSVIGTWIFYGFGLGYFGTVSPLEGVGLAVGIYLVQVLASGLWLRRFRFGPLEWLWRTLTYARLQPLLRA